MYIPTSKIITLGFLTIDKFMPAANDKIIAEKQTLTTANSSVMRLIEKVEKECLLLRWISSKVQQ